MPALRLADYLRQDLVFCDLPALDKPTFMANFAKGMGQIVSTEFPIFSGFRSLFPGSGGASYAILSVLEEKQLKEVIAMLCDVCKNFTEKGRGVVFTLPMSNFVG